MKSGVNRLLAATSTGHSECNLQLKVSLAGPSGQRAKRTNEHREWTKNRLSSSLIGRQQMGFKVGEFRFCVVVTLL